MIEKIESKEEVEAKKAHKELRTVKQWMEAKTKAIRYDKIEEEK